jgi:hypothetical protein
MLITERGFLMAEQLVGWSPGKLKAKPQGSMEVWSCSVDERHQTQTSAVVHLDQSISGRHAHHAF